MELKVKQFPRTLGVLLIREAPTFAVALAVAEVFFKFGSFSLELVAFLVLWRSLRWAYLKGIGAPE